VSPLVLKLNAELQRTTEPTLRAELLARIGCCLARIGYLDEARKIVAELRSDFGAGQSGRTTIWIMLTEGLIHWFGSLNNQALDRVARAQLLSVAMNYSTGIAISSAWKAYIELEQSKHEFFFDSLRLARQHAASGDNDVLARITILLSSASAIAGRLERTRFWFHRGRHYSLLDGDQTSIEALQYNRAGFTLAWARAEHCLLAPDQALLKDLRIELDSARHLQVLTGVEAFKNHLRLSHARLLILEEKYVDAKVELVQARSEAPFADFHFAKSFIDLELAYCDFKLGRCDSALEQFDSIEFEAIKSLELDDQLFAAFARYEMSSADPRFGISAELAVELNHAREAYRAWLAKLRDGLEKFEANFPET
jgi:hypothetical protein